LFVKIMAEYKYKRSRVDAIKFEPRKPSQMKQYSFSIEHENDIRTLCLSNILDRAKQHINFKKVVVEPYGARVRLLSLKLDLTFIGRNQILEFVHDWAICVIDSLVKHTSNQTLRDRIESTSD
jgi:hypothetical protein